MLIENTTPVAKPLIVFIVLLPCVIFISKTGGDIYLTLTGLFFVFYSVKHKKYDWLEWNWVRAILAFILVAMVSACFSPFPKEAFIQSVIYLRWPLAAIALVSLVLINQQRLQLFERAALVFLVLVIADGVLQMVTGADILGHQVANDIRMTGFFSKRVLGVYSLKLFFFSFVALYIFLEKSLRNILLLSLLLVGFNVFLLFTGERIVFLLGMLFLFLWSIVVISIFKPLRIYFYVGGLIFISALVVIMIVSKGLLAKRVMPFLDAMEGFSDTTYGKIFNSAFELWQTNPLVGVGTRMYNEVCVAKLGYPQDESLVDQVSGLCVRHPHNIYFELLAQNGIVGLLLFILVIYSIFRIISAKNLWKTDPLLTIIISGSVIVIFWPLASSMSIFSNNYAGAVWLTIAWAIARARLMLPVVYMMQRKNQ